MARRFTLIINKASGNDAKAQSREIILGRLQAAGAEVELAEFSPDEDVAAFCEQAVQKAARTGASVIAAGGDGTINTVAGFCHRYGVTLGIVPLGTFNYFARDLGIPLDAAAAAEVLVTGRPRHVAAGFANDQIFLVNASIGLYAKVIRNREEDKARFGRYRLVALVSAVASFFRRQKVFDVEIGTGAQQIRRRTLMVFACKNRFQLENLGLAGAADAAPDRLCFTILKPLTRLQAARTLLLGLAGALAQEERVEEYSAPAFTLATRDRHARIVVDGEIVRLQTPLLFRAEPSALTVIAP